MVQRLLLIDDESLITRTLQKLLKKAGYEVVVAPNGQSALTEIEKNNFSLIICDVRMPDMDGVETIKALRKSLQEQGKAPVPEIFITGYADEQKYKSAVELKVADYIYKPFDRDEFIKVVERNLKKQPNSN